MLQSYLTVIRRYPNIIALGVMATLFSNFGQTFFIGLYNEHFRSLFDLSSTAFGSIYSGVTVCSAITLLFIGHFIDKISLHRYITIICLSLAAGCMLIYWAPALPLFILGLGLVRFLGQGVMTHLSSTVTARYVKEGRGKGLSLASLGISLGGAFFPLMATASDAALGWRTSWLVYGVLYLSLVLPIMLKLAPKRNIELPDELEDTLHPNTSVKTVLRDPTFWAVIITGMLLPFLMTGIFFHQRFIMDSLGYSQTLYASLFVLFGATGMIASFVVGALVDKLGSDWMLRVYLIPFLLAIWLLMSISHPLALAAWMVATAISASCFHPAQGSFLAERYGTKRLGALKSVLTSSIVLSSAIAPALFGYLIDTTANVMVLLNVSWITTAIILFGINWQLRRSATIARN